MAKFGGGSIESQFRRFKRRLKWLLQNTAETQDGIVEILRGRHVEISRATVSRWMAEESTHAPSCQEMIALMMSHEDVSMDWLIGRKPPETISEKFIESKV